jgi:uncharacterized protein YbjT (DUF2867 family)
MIVITTPTGQIGRQVLDNLLPSGQPIRVVVRDPARLPAHAADRVEIVPGSADDATVLTEAFADADSVFLVVPPNPSARSVPGHVLDFVQPACEAIAKHSVARVVAVSSLGRGIARNAGQMSAIFAMDDLIESTGVSYRSLCPPGFMENMLWQIEPITTQGAFFLPYSPELKHPTCATRDIAAVASGLLLDDAWTGQESIPLLGPEDLSYNDMARILTEVLERPVRFQQIPGEAYQATLMAHGASQAWAQGLAAMAAAIERGSYDIAPGISRANTPTTFRQWCEQVLRPAVRSAPASPAAPRD